MRANIKLIDVGTLDIRLKTYSKSPKYERHKKLIIRKENIKINIKKLKEAIETLQHRYPNKGYYLERDKVNFEGKKRIFWIIGRKESSLKGIPLYYSTTIKRLFIPSSFILKKRRLVNTVLLYRLRDLGVSYSLRNVR